MIHELTVQWFKKIFFGKRDLSSCLGPAVTYVY